MVFYRDNQWNISEFEITYIDGTEQTTKRIGAEGEEWWRELESLWEDIEVLEIKEVEVTQEQRDRLDNINATHVPDGFGSIVGDYVRSGIFPDELTHRLKDIEWRESSRSQGVELSEREIEAVYLAIQISDLELQLIELGGGV